MFVVRKPKVGCDVSKVLVNKMFNRTNMHMLGYDVATKELRWYKPHWQLVEKNDSQHWAATKLTKE